MRPPGFAGAQDRSTAASLLGPFDGQVVDATTSAPVSGATVVALWTYDEGRGLTHAAGTVVETFMTDAAGRYKIPAVDPRTEVGLQRLVAFDLIVYKRGYVSYRSDADFDGRARLDFVQRHHRVELRKWRETDSHANHLAFLRPPAELERQVAWERGAANEALYLAQTRTRPTSASEAGGAEASSQATSQAGSEDAVPAIALLDARPLLPPEEVKRRTGIPTSFQVKDLGDLTRTHFYHGVHLEASIAGEDSDVAYRVWKDPPGGLEVVRETFEASLPGVQPTSEIVDPTWIYDQDDVRAVAFLDQERSIGVLLTCGPAQCIDVETALILAKFIYNRLDQLSTEAAPSAE